MGAANISNNLDVKITADVVDLQQKFAVARAETTALGSEMRKLAQDSAAGVGPVDQSRFAQLAQDYLQTKAAAASYSAQMKESAEASRGLGDSIEEARGQLSTLFQVTGAAATLEAVRAIADGVLKIGERAQEIGSMSDVLGVTTAQFQAMGVASEEAGVSQEVFFRAAEHLNTTLQEARDHSGSAIASLKDLGLTNEQLASKSTNLVTVLQVIHGRLNNSATASAEMSELTRLLGSRAALAAEAFKAFDGSAASVAAIMARINGLTDDQIHKLSSAAIFWKTLGTEFTNVASKMGIGITEMLTAQNNLGGGDSFTDMRASIEQTTQAAQASAKAQQAAKQQSIQGSIAAELYGTQAVTEATLRSEQDQVEATQSGSAQRVAATRQLYQDTLQFYNNDPQVEQVRTANRQMIAAGKEFNSAQTSSFREQLNEFKYSMNQEVAAFQQSRQQIDAAAKESATIVAQNTSSDIRIARANLEARKSLLEADVANTASASAQKFETLKRLTTQEYEQDEQLLEVQLSLQDAGTAAYNKTCNDIKELRAKLNQSLAGLDQQQAAAARRAAEQDATSWKGAVNQIESAEGSLVGDLIGKRRSLSQSLLQIGGSMLQQELTNDIKAATTQMLLKDKQLAQEKALEQGGLLYHLLTANQAVDITEVQVTAQTMAQKQAAAQQISTTASAAAASRAAGAAANSGVVMADAAKAFSGTYASVAQIPYVGWILAPAAGAAAFAAVAAYEGLASLDTGTARVPQDMVARIHKDEAVLPKPMAQSFRDGTLGGGAEQGAGGDVHYHTHNWSAFDSGSVRTLIRSNSFQNELASSMRMHYGRGGR